jgi:hypothetical protein
MLDGREPSDDELELIREQTRKPRGGEPSKGAALPRFLQRLVDSPDRRESSHLLRVGETCFDFGRTDVSDPADQTATACA